MKLLTPLALSLLLTTPASAQSTVREDPLPLVIAMSGVVVVSAGFGVMLHAQRGRDCGCTNTGEIVGGIAVVSAGVTMVYLGLRARRVVILPSVRGVNAIIVWGGK